MSEIINMQRVSEQRGRESMVLCDAVELVEGEAVKRTPKPSDRSGRMVMVVSAVNIRKGGTLTVLRDCLRYLSDLMAQSDLKPREPHDKEKEDTVEQKSYAISGERKASETPGRVIAIVHDKSLCEFPGIEYIEIPWSVKSWIRRLWCEYVTMSGISEKLASKLGRPVDLWLSLHDTTPRVIALKQEVYCQTSFPFLKRRLRDLWMDPKVFLFSLFTKFAYRINIRENSSVIVQQEWFRDAMAEMLHLPKELFRVIPPVVSIEEKAVGDNVRVSRLADNIGPQKVNSELDANCISQQAAAVGAKGLRRDSDAKTFFYASTADCHKNFELLFEASRLLEDEVGRGKFRVAVTIKGDENRYSRWLRRRWGDVSAIEWTGFLPKEELFVRYREADCFVFPSRIETWGLPVTEYMAVSDGPVLISDLPYAYETIASGKKAGNHWPNVDNTETDRFVGYFNTDDPHELSEMMKRLLTAEIKAE